MPDVRGLHRAAAAKKDEFYTQLCDIENELRHYKAHFRGKTVLCNCDDPYESEFFKYFAMNFNSLGLKKLIATCYVSSPVAGTELFLPFDEPPTPEPVRTPLTSTNRAHKIIITEVTDENRDGRVDLADVEHLIKNRKNVLTFLEGDGDFRSEECVELLKEADVVVTNPPFSLFREYVAQLMEYGKKFLIIGNINCATYKEFFPLIQGDKVWIGVSIHSHGRDFRVPDDYPLKAYEYRTDAAGHKYINVKGVRWFTNLDIKQRHENMILYKNYTPEAYPKYDNYDAIEVSKTADIPCDYDGVMGVPVTFLDKYSPEQFEILGDSRYHDGQNVANDINILNGKKLYRRILIRRRT